MTYTTAAIVGVLGAILLDRLLGTDLLRRKAFWAAYAIVLFFQLIVNGLLTGLEIVRYDPDQILGPRIVFAPVEDLLFGFAMVTATLTLWVWVGRRDARRGSGPARRATGPARRPGTR
ncbi:MAG TPA: lycopene cyclase domain-containing protein [Jatrophihabitans sp.]|jgi:lycopene cyclase domain-containing protein|uniref:lycopene cyclase domain-containing protein n=1 Tax=Jatrophihabitans sp. TaxID=1932789 RepID=UPI002E006C87|nr:lycopene cyclase domain-containing protein [Jatrophihabitans sp.]